VDHDVAATAREKLMAEVQRLRDGIRRYRDATGHGLCWQHPDLWGLLPERTDAIPRVSDWSQFLQGCIRYRQSLGLLAPTAPRTSEPYDR
jgi:hypothetical protein